MILISLCIKCDGCRKYFGKAQEHRDILMRRDIEALRVKALVKGWARYRLENTAPNGDYCPGCQRAQKRKPI